MKGKGTTDAIYIVWQMQEKFRAKAKKLYFGFVERQQQCEPSCFMSLQHIKGFIHRGVRLGLYGNGDPITLTQLAEDADESLFKRIRYNEHHVLQQFLSDYNSLCFSFRRRRHNFSKTNDRNFITRQLFNDIYWTLVFQFQFLFVPRFNCVCISSNALSYVLPNWWVWLLTNYHNGPQRSHNGPQQSHNGPQRPCAYILVAIHTDDNAPSTHQTAPQTLKNYKHII